MQQGAGKAEQLPLTGREVVAPLPYFLIQAMIQLGDELICVDIMAYPQDLLIRHPIHPQQQVGTNGAGEQEHILQHLAKMPPQRGDL